MWIYDTPGNESVKFYYYLLQGVPIANFGFDYSTNSLFVNNRVAFGLH